MAQLKLLYDAWWPIRNPNPAANKPKWENFRKRFERYFQKGSPVTLPKVDRILFKKRIDRTPDAKARGLDDWTIKELK